MRKVLFIIVDGLGDRPIFELGNLTPLEAAKKPNLDKIASRAITGLMHTVDIGIRPGSDVAHLSVFGYNIKKYYTGRGPFEAAGYGIDLKKGDVAFRGNFATVDKNFKVVDRRAGRISNTAQLVNLINGMKIKGVEVIVKKGVGHRVAVVFRAKTLDGEITDIDPHEVGAKVLKSKAKKKTKKNEKCANIANLFTKKTYDLLKNHQGNKERKRQNKPPANIVLLRGAGIIPEIPSFYDKYKLKAACIAGAGLYKGIAKLLGMTIINVEQATGMPDTNIKEKIKKALNTLKKYDFVFVHIKGTDVLAEDGDYIGKKKFIEKMDKAFLPLVDEKSTLLVITADHSTSSFLKIHTADPVPVLIAGQNIHIDSVKNFGERTVASGKLGHIQGKHLMPIINDLIGRAPLMGA